MSGARFLRACTTRLSRHANTNRWTVGRCRWMADWLVEWVGLTASFLVQILPGALTGGVRAMEEEGRGWIGWCHGGKSCLIAVNSTPRARRFIDHESVDWVVNGMLQQLAC